MKTLITDIDEVLLKFSAIYEPWVISELEKRNFDWVPYYSDHGLWIYDDHPDLDAELINDFINNSPKFSNLPAVDDAAHYLRMFREDGWDIIGLSACINTDHVVEKRLHNIKNSLGFELDDLIHVGVMQSKHAELSKLNKGVFVDDSWSHCIAGHLTGHRVYWFSDHDSPNNIIPSVSNWSMIAAMEGLI